MPKSNKILILGDFNLQVCCPSKPLVNEFIPLLDSFNLTQHVMGPAHEHGHTLDLSLMVLILKILLFQIINK